MPCSHCGKDVKIVGRGWCRACYIRWHKTGSLEYKRKGKPISLCSEDGCNSPHVARGFCEKHYRMFIRKGLPNSLFGYGERQNHPLYGVWLQSRRVKEGRDPAWDNFWVFVQDVEKTKPESSDGEKYFFCRIDITKRFGPDNFFWKKRQPHLSDPKEYQKRWRKINPEKAKSLLLKKQFGIDLNEYIAMFERQGGKCYICNNPGNIISERKNCSATLVVDHCHKTGKIRKLLCNNCNTGIGYLKEDISVLRNAIAYIKEHKAKDDSPGHLPLFDTSESGDEDS